MFPHAVMRALRKNKTLRYGVPMLVSAARKSVEAGFRKGWDLWSGWSETAGTL